MSWTVPSGCKYAFIDATAHQTYYYSAGDSVPTEREPNTNNTKLNPFCLVDFSNGYIYMLNCQWFEGTIFTIDSSQSSITGHPPTSTYAVTRSMIVYATNFTRSGEVHKKDFSVDSGFVFGNGQNMLDKSSFPSGVSYIAYYTFAYRTDITRAYLPSGITSLEGAFYGCSNLVTPPEIPSSVTTMTSCFSGCSALATAPAIPSSVTNIDYCFYSCSALAGTIKVYNSPTYYTNVVKKTANDIFVINGAGTSAVEATWETIASGYSNVHYEADDNPVPSLSFTATRVGSMASETPSENGEYAFINATAIVYETYLPDGWSCAYDTGEENITKDGTTQSPTWTRTDNDNVWSLKCWLSLGDTTKHTFTLQVGDEITDENDNVKASHLSDVITQIISKAYKLVDYYHDPTTDTEGMSIGKFATEANLFDVDMPALFRDTLSLTDGNAVARLLFDYVYPVGSYYETSKPVSEFDPNDVWGGTWVLETAGLVHIGAGTGYTLGDTGGSKYIQEHTHGFTQPVYTVTGGAVTDGITGGSHHHATSRKANAGAGTARYIPDADSTSNNVSTTDTTHKHNLPSHSHTVTRTTNGAVNAVSGLPADQSTGSAGNMPPYIVVNRWHRTA